MNVVITIPAYNEESTISRIIKEIKEIMGSTNFNYKILVLDDGSRDQTVEVAKKEGAIVVSNKINLGLAETFQREMEECLKLKADVIVHTDADGQYPAKYIPKMVNKVLQGNDLVLGSRFGRGNYGGSLIKKMGNMAFAKVFSSLLNQKINDTTTGFRAFNSEVAKLKLINNFTYTQEQLIRARRKKMRIAEIPIRARKTRKSRLFKNPLDYAIKAWINILRIYRDFAPLKFFGYTGGFLLLIGFLIGLFIFVRILTIGGSGGIPRVILSAVLMLTGLQIIIFGFLADMIKRD
ncbi:MAG: glycosyltransferase family 2 protein [Nanoarchaeota archaeon]|nr:glycosyltransferase family 2 protein [Nanoarchaeota archaeon]MBU1622598.1 glycosyltransferase family 2 protein [Nanoarchaeota archaeon]MBU1974696.1 glycosyltransferase family 2 protein [Nanoarchaeota archaeon]